MGALLTPRNIVTAFYRALEGGRTPWTQAIMSEFPTTTSEELIAWLGQTPAMRKWVGPRTPTGIRDEGVTIYNEAYEASMDLSADEVRWDKSAQIMARVNEFGIRAAQHWDDLLSTLIVAGETALCYDGQAYFDVDHSEGDSGTQSNDLALTAVDADVPTVAEVAADISAAINALIGFRDDRGKAMNAAAAKFLVMTPAKFFMTTKSALTGDMILSGAAAISNVLKAPGFAIDVVANPELDLTAAWITTTRKLLVFRVDSPVSPFIGIDEYGTKTSAQAAGSYYEDTYNKHRYGIKANRGVGYGYWQHAVLVTSSND